MGYQADADSNSVLLYMEPIDSNVDKINCFGMDE